MELNNGSNSFFIKANLSSGFLGLSFPASFHRARKNSIDLFNEVILKKVKAVNQFENERSFSIALEENYALVFKMHGNFANVLLTKDGRVNEIFRNHLQTDFEITYESLNRQIDFSKENFLKNDSQWRSIYFTFGKVVWDYLEERNFEKLTNESQWQLFNSTVGLLENPTYYLIQKEERLIFSLLPFEGIQAKWDDPIMALNEFTDRLIHDLAFYRTKHTALQQLRTKLKGGENYLKKNKDKYNELVNDRHNQLWADLIMANMHKIKTGQDKVVLSSFYDQSDVVIKLKRELTPQKNAEIFYRKAKNKQIEIDKLKEAISQKENEIIKLDHEIGLVEVAVDLKELKKMGLVLNIKNKSKSQPKNLPFHEFEFKGYKILVGRNAEANDKLTLKHAYKEDLWLHAKDVAGSHVLIKHQAGKQFPKEVIEYAASLAAYNSKRKNESLCPVAVTPKKYVRKRKGDPAGMVVVEREEVILVEPLSVNR